MDEDDYIAQLNKDYDEYKNYNDYNDYIDKVHNMLIPELKTVLKSKDGYDKYIVTEIESYNEEYPQDIIYEISYNDHKREIRLNDILIASLNFGSTAHLFFKYVFGHPNEEIPLNDLIEKANITKKERNIHIARDCGFVKTLKKIFFPVITNKTVLFRNPIRKKYAEDNQLPSIDLETLKERSKSRRSAKSKI